MPNNAKKQVYREKEFGIYVLWKSLPAHIKGMKKNELLDLGFTNPLIAQIIKIKNQTEFAKYFRIKDLGTLTDWNNRIINEDITSPFLTSTYQKEFRDLNEKIILPNIDELKNKISEQDKIISSLKKENALFKKRINARAQKTIKKVPSTQNSPSKEKPVTAPTNTSQANTANNEVNKNILQKIKNLFRK
jgi:hypothetical protein